MSCLFRFFLISHMSSLFPENEEVIMWVVVCNIIQFMMNFIIWTLCFTEVSFENESQSALRVALKCIFKS